MHNLQPKYSLVTDKYQSVWLKHPSRYLCDIYTMEIQVIHLTLQYGMDTVSM